MSEALPSIRGWIGMDISSFDIILPLDLINHRYFDYEYIHCHDYCLI